MRSELLPCPFCGGTNIDAEGWRNSEGATGPACDDCGASAGTIDGKDNVAAWNTRAPSQAEAKLSAVRETLRSVCGIREIYAAIDHIREIVK